eukprot:scaffold106235_cov26-Phaeocystis_antarctica.AAC.1
MEWLEQPVGGCAGMPSSASPGTPFVRSPALTNQWFVMRILSASVTSLGSPPVSTSWKSFPSVCS